VALIAAIYVSRVQLRRIAIAVSAYRAGIFTAPPQIADESRWPGVRDAAQFYWDFSQVPSARQERLELVEPTLGPLVKEINERQAAGEDMHYSMHIYREVRWLLNW
jgi:hypothetical protein